MQLSVFDCMGTGIVAMMVWCRFNMYALCVSMIRYYRDNAKSQDVKRRNYLYVSGTVQPSVFADFSTLTSVPFSQITKIACFATFISMIRCEHFLRGWSILQ